MKEQAEKLRHQIKDLELKLQQIEIELEEIERNCPHSWTKAVYCGEYIPGYQTKGDPPGTMGVDRQLPTYIPPQTIDRWQRECVRCGKVQNTKRVQEKVSKEPLF